MYPFVNIQINGHQVNFGCPPGPPYLREIPAGHTTFSEVVQGFQKSWKSGVCPRVKKLYNIMINLSSEDAYVRYRSTHGNECSRYHGTERSCQLGEDGYTIPCTSQGCKACSIIRTSFQVSLARGNRAFGQGVYTSSASNKSANYSRSGVMFVTKVVLGNVYTVSDFGQVSSCPSGYQSVVLKGHNKWNETVVYTNDAIRPVYLIIYGY